MARSVRDLDLFITTVYASYPWRRDPNVPFNPWSRVDSSGWPVDRVRTEGAPYGWAGKGGRLRIGVWRDDGIVMPVKPVRRAMDVVIERLRADERFELVDYEGYNQQEGWDIIVSSQFIPATK
jgi:amidase